MVHAIPAGPSRVRPLSIGPLTIDPPVLQAHSGRFYQLCLPADRPPVGRRGPVGHRDGHCPGFLHIEERSHAFPDRLWGVREEPRPLAVQIWDNDPASLAAVGERLAREFRVSLVDINFGCPVKDVSEKGKKRFVPASLSGARGGIRPRGRGLPAHAGDGQDPRWAARGTRSTPSTWHKRWKGPAGRP